MKVNFEDGEEGLGLLIKGKKKDDNTFEFQALDSSAKGLGGLHLGGQWRTRKLIFKDWKTYWSLNGEEFLVKSFTEVKASEALGWAKDIGSVSQSETCDYAKMFSSAAPKKATDATGQPTQ